MQKGENNAEGNANVPSVVAPDETTMLSPESAKAAVKAMTKIRAVMSDYIGEHLKSGTDYGPIHIARECPHKYAPKECKNEGHWSKPVLFKPGSEKMAQLFNLRAEFSRDDETREMAGMPGGTFFYLCRIVDRGGRVWGEGRGACAAGDKGRDVNSAIKIAEKRAQIDATLRAFSLSDQFTQDLEDGPVEDEAPRAAQRTQAPKPAAGTPTPPRPMTEPQKALIDRLLGQLGTPIEKADEFCRQRFSVPVKDLTSAQASALIDALKKKVIEPRPEPPAGAQKKDPVGTIGYFSRKITAARDNQELVGILRELETHPDAAGAVGTTVQGLLNARRKELESIADLHKEFAG